MMKRRHEHTTDPYFRVSTFGWESSKSRGDVPTILLLESWLLENLQYSEKNMHKNDIVEIILCSLWGYNDPLKHNWLFDLFLHWVKSFPFQLTTSVLQHWHIGTSVIDNFCNVGLLVYYYSSLGLCKSVVCYCCGISLCQLWSQCRSHNPWVP